MWAVFFGSNVNFIRQATDYFAQGFVDSSPFQHYWSLAVEEQFYLVWPALFLLVTRLHGLTLFGVAVRWRARVATAVCTIGAGSLAWSIVATEHEPVGAYFSTFTRAWELALGALIGITATSATRLPRRLARAASAAGVALFVAACAVIGAHDALPGRRGPAADGCHRAAHRRRPHRPSRRSRTGRSASHRCASSAASRTPSTSGTGRSSCSQPPCTPR